MKLRTLILSLMFCLLPAIPAVAQDTKKVGIAVIFGERIRRLN